MEEKNIVAQVVCFQILELLSQKLNVTSERTVPHNGLYQQLSPLLVTKYVLE